jgi:hypothetical protein
MFAKRTPGGGVTGLPLEELATWDELEAAVAPAPPEPAAALLLVPPEEAASTTVTRHAGESVRSAGMDTAAQRRGAAQPRVRTKRGNMRE